MRKTILMTSVVLALAGAAWWWAEDYAAQKAQVALEANPLTQAQFDSLRQVAKAGVRATQLRIGTEETNIEIDGTRVYVPLWSIFQTRLVLPETAVLTHTDQQFPLEAARAELRSGLGVTRKLAVQDGLLLLDSVSLARTPLVGRANVDMRLAHRGLLAPPEAVSAYTADFSVEGLMLPTLARLLPPSSAASVQALTAIGNSVTMHGVARIWLDRTIDRETLTEGALAPGLVGFETSRTTIRMGESEAILIAHLTPDENGLAKGLVALLSSDVEAVIGALSAAGVLPAQADALAGPITQALGVADGGSLRDSDDLQIRRIAAMIPAPQPDQTQIVLRFENGQVSLGPMKLGPAPRLMTRG